MLNAGMNIIKESAHTFMTLLSCPSIGMPSSSSFLQADFLKSGVGKLLAGTLFKGLPIFCSSYSERLENQIGTQVVISKGSTDIASNLACDNIAPQPRVWKMDGYISFGAQYNLSGTISTDSLTTSLVDALGALPGGGSIGKLTGVSEGLLSKPGEQLLLMMCKVYLRWIRDQRGPFKFTTREGEQLDAIIRSVEFIDEADTDNAVHVNLELVEFRALYLWNDAKTGILSSAIIGNSPTLGSIFGSPAGATSIVATAFVSLGKMLPVSLVSDVDEWEANDGEVYYGVSEDAQTSGSATENFGQAVSQDNADNAIEEATENDTVEEVTFVDGDGELVTTEIPATTTAVKAVRITDADAITTVCEAMGVTISELLILLNNPLRTTAYVAQSPFADMATSDENGDRVYLDAVTSNISFDDVSLTVEARKSLADSIWWIELSGSAGDETVNLSTRVSFNTAHFDNSEFTLLLVSPTIPSTGDVTFEDLTENEQSAVLSSALLVFTR